MTGFILFFFKLRSAYGFSTDARARNYGIYPAQQIIKYSIYLVQLILRDYIFGSWRPYNEHV